MEREQELAIIRRAYAKQILAQAQVDDSRLEQAFAEVHREDFLGPGPWVIPRWFDEYVPTPSADPVYLYIDSVVQVIAERHLNNGQPSGHAIWITSASIKAGEHVVHIGTGTGYYTAIMACLVGPSGKVTGIELDASLAACAKEKPLVVSQCAHRQWRRHVSAVRCCRCHLYQRWRDPTGRFVARKIDRRRTLDFADDGKSGVHG